MPVRVSVHGALSRWYIGFCSSAVRPRTANSPIRGAFVQKCGGRPPAGRRRNFSMSILDICQTLQDMGPATSLRESQFMFPLLEGSHLLGLALMMAPVLMF